MAEGHELEALHAVLSKASIGEGEWASFSKDLTIKRIPKGDYLVRAGDGVEHAYFCVKGIFRLFYTLEDGKEYIKSFLQEHDFVTAYRAMIRREVSHFSIQALEDCAAIAIPYGLMLEKMAGSHAWERFVRICIEQMYIKKEERERQLLFLNASDRYRAFLESYPGVAGRVPQYHVASYLGISPVSLSRLMHGDRN